MLLGTLAGSLLGMLMGFLSIFLVLLILVQRGRGGGLTGALGGPGGQSAFGSKAGDTFTLITVVVATIWGFSCAFTMWLLGTHAPSVSLTKSTIQPGPRDDASNPAGQMVLPTLNENGSSGLGSGENDLVPADSTPATPSESTTPAEMKDPVSETPPAEIPGTETPAAETPAEPAATSAEAAPDATAAEENP